MRYFYIVTFDDQIFELTYTEEKITSALKAWKNGELLLFKELGSGIHANSISKILNEDLYESYTFSVKPKLFIRDGTWYDGVERRIVRHEPWKQRQIDQRKKLEEPKEYISEEERKRIDEIKKEISSKFKRI